MMTYLKPVSPDDIEQNSDSPMPLSAATLAVITSLSLPQQSEPHYSETEAIQTILAQPWPDWSISPDPELLCSVSKPELRQFIAWALHQSYAPVLTNEEKLKLLDVAWAVQNLLWSLK